MSSKADLHIHTKYSDGAFSPKEIVRKAYRKGIEVIGITDHDSIDGIKEAQEEAKKFNIEVIPGVELSTDVDNTEVHLLGYLFDLESKELEKYLKFFKEERYFRAKLIVQKLNNLGLSISMDEVEKIAGKSPIGRPHIAIAMVKLGLVGNYYEAFWKYLKNDGPAFEKKIHISPISAIKIINDHGGLAFVAHPGNMKEKLLFDLIEAGIDGIEVVHPSHTLKMQKFYEKITEQYCLLKSGGSDFHGGEKEDENNFGKFTVPLSFVNEIKSRLFRPRIEEY